MIVLVNKNKVVVFQLPCYDLVVISVFFYTFNSLIRQIKILYNIYKNIIIYNGYYIVTKY